MHSKQKRMGFHFVVCCHPLSYIGVIRPLAGYTKTPRKTICGEFYIQDKSNLNSLFSRDALKRLPENGLDQRVQRLQLLTEQRKALCTLLNNSLCFSLFHSGLLTDVQNTDCFVLFNNQQIRMLH